MEEEGGGNMLFMYVIFCNWKCISKKTFILTVQTPKMIILNVLINTKGVLAGINY